MEDLTVSLRHEDDVGRVRQGIHQLAQQFGLAPLARTRLTIVTSALAYQWLSDMGVGVVASWVEDETACSPRALLIRFSGTGSMVAPPMDALLFLPPPLQACVASVRGLVEGAE